MGLHYDSEYLKVIRLVDRSDGLSPSPYRIATCARACLFVGCPCIIVVPTTKELHIRKGVLEKSGLTLEAWARMSLTNTKLKEPYKPMTHSHGSHLQAWPLFHKGSIYYYEIARAAGIVEIHNIMK